MRLSRLFGVIVALLGFTGCDSGAAGEMGAQGLQGPQGDVGPQGPPGDQGAPGVQGPPGAVGLQGVYGASPVYDASNTCNAVAPTFSCSVGCEGSDIAIAGSNVGVTSSAGTITLTGSHQNSTSVSSWTFDFTATGLEGVPTVAVHAVCFTPPP